MKEKKVKFPKGFFSKSRPHATKQDEDYIPIVSLKRKNIG